MKRKAVELDAIDRRIVAILREEGRITNQALSERVGLSARPCLERVRKLEASGLIQGYGVRLAPELAGHAVVAFASISLRDHSVGRRERVEKVLKACPDVVELQVVSGDADYLARIVAGSLADYEELTGTWLADAQLGVAKIATTFALKALKGFEGYPLGEG